MFQTFRYGLDKLYYQFPAPNGIYNVELYFTEPWLGIGGSMDATGMRLFDVAINDKIVLKDLDIWKEAGSNAALKKTFQVKVNDGMLRISFPNTKVGQAIIAAIAVASRNGNVQKAPSFQMIKDLNCTGCSINSWLDEGDELFKNAEIQINKLPSSLFGSDWLFAERKNLDDIHFVLTDTADVYLAIESGLKISKEYERLNDSVITDEDSGRKYDLHRKRFIKGERATINYKGVGLIAIQQATNMQPAYDLKPTTSYKSDVAIFNKSVEKKIISNNERTVIKNDDNAEIVWPIETGVADVYSITVKYNSPLEKDIDAMLQLFDVSNKKLVEEPVQFKFTKTGKWNYVNINTGSMINAGSYKVKLVTKNAEGLIISNIDVQ
ncbi:malectin domain-containing carbohydrate-binding protein [Niabella ginsengisoli]|uniref:Malectin n=1 Tax=Niabella ginsengisoli TaxID=522298 RepID=A0ABS9SK76_9BACT|nr:malectin domain-containing carbohydrate-binding protein [Niabella ginsengisoli]MCH5598769.1 malectin [Niabella ginsengisoli]